MSTQKHARWLVVILILLTLMAALIPPMVMAQDTTQVELVGIIEAMDVDTITINGQVITIANTELNTTLELGNPVKVHATLLADGSLLAREVNSVTAEDDGGGLLPNEAEVVGEVTSVDGDTLIVAGQIIDVSSAEVQAGVTVGTVVSVKVTFSAARNQWVAREVNLNTSDDNSNDNTADFAGGETEFTGTLTEIGDDYIVVGDQIISTVDAEIDDELILGALVKIHLTLVNDVLTAREVQLSGNDDDSTVVVPADCLVAQPSGWTTYTIQSGDTLSGIASRAGSSIGELALANCITDARLIVAGTRLFVPRAVAPPTANDNDDNGNDDNGNDDNGNDDNGNDDNGNDDNGNDDNGNDDNGNDDNGNDDNGNDDNGNDDNGNDDNGNDDNGNDDNGNDDNGNDDSGNDDSGNDDDDN